MQSSFLQSPEWEAFQQAIGRQTFRLSGLLFIRMPLPFKKSYLYCPRFIAKDTIASSFQEIKKVAAASDIFVRLEPMSEVRSQKLEVRSYRCPSMQPKQTVVLDLAKSDNELLAKMKPKTRYNIRLAVQKEIRSQKSEVSSFNQIWKMMQETAKRDKFSTHSKTYYSTMLEVLGKYKMAHLLTAYHHQDLLAAMILIIYKDQAIYLHGASSNHKRNLMAPYLLHWEAIKFAKSCGSGIYDFWGINKKKSEVRSKKSAQVDGVTKFKLGFGGAVVEYPDSFEISLQPLEYSGYRIIRKIDRLIKPRRFQ